MPTREQVERAMEGIRDATASDFIERDGTLHDELRAIDEPGDLIQYRSLDDKYQQIALEKYVDWEGFTESEEQDVIRRVISGESPDFWMDGLGGEGVAPDPVMEQVIGDVERGWPEAAPAEFSDMMQDIANPPRFDGPSDYEKAIRQSADRAQLETDSEDRGVPER